MRLVNLMAVVFAIVLPAFTAADDLAAAVKRANEAAQTTHPLGRRLPDLPNDADDSDGPVVSRLGGRWLVRLRGSLGVLDCDGDAPRDVVRRLAEQWRDNLSVRPLPSYLRSFGSPPTCSGGNCPAPTYRWAR